jgi:hypothetical protein
VKDLERTRELSGKVEYAKCKCYECGKIFNQLMPIEFMEDVETWRIDGFIAFPCGCEIKNRGEELKKQSANNVGWDDTKNYIDKMDKSKGYLLTNAIRFTKEERGEK